MPACQATSTSCTETILQSNYEGTACDTTSCDSLDCGYGLGCSTALLTTYPTNCLQSTAYDECLKCADGYFNYEATCVLDCPTDYFRETVDGDNLCVTSQYATERLVVDPSSSDSSVYKTLYAAMHAVSAQKSIIYLVGGSHTLEIDSSITPSSEKQLDPLYQTATKRSFRLTTAYCDEINVPNCVTDDSKAKIVLRDPLMKITSYFTTFNITDLIFDGASALDASCPVYYCQYCPYYQINESLLFDDRYSLHDISLINQGLWKTDCAKYNAVNFISSGNIKDGSFSISSCEFNNFRYEMKSVVRATYVKVNIEDTVFSNIIPYTAAVYIGEGSEVNIQAITVRLLNNGFEYRNDITQSPFLVLLRALLQ
jgi:hypothetical protein